MVNTQAFQSIFLTPTCSREDEQQQCPYDKGGYQSLMLPLQAGQKLRKV